MMYRKEILTALGTLGCAAAIGFVMQSTDAAKTRYGEDDIQQTVEALEKTAHVDEALMNVEEITLTSAEFGPSVIAPKPYDNVEPLMIPAQPDQPRAGELPQLQVAQNASTGSGLMGLLDTIMPKADPQPTAVSAPSALIKPVPVPLPAEPNASACEIIANARPIAAAMVQLTVDADCLPNERLAIHHSGMVFSETTDADGHLDVTVPALAQEALFIVAFTNGDGGVAQTKVEELQDYDRVVLQWSGAAGMEIHAREFGADYGEAGHVWAEAARDMSYAVTGQGGFITRHGNTNMADALVAEVYSYPARTTQRAGVIDLTVEAEVGLDNCGLEVEATTLQTFRGGDVTTRDLTLAVPDCDAAGSFLVLNNLLEDLKVASN